MEVFVPLEGSHEAPLGERSGRGEASPHRALNWARVVDYPSRHLSGYIRFVACREAPMGTEPDGLGVTRHLAPSALSQGSSTKASIRWLQHIALRSV
jgi:hypothetical protein